MGKQSRIKKERRLARQNGGAGTTPDLRVLDNAAVIPGDMLVAYLITKFIGKAGYKYISIGRHGSLFMNDKSSNIVAITLHREYPVMSVRGRFNDPQRRDIAVNAIHVPTGYPGIVIGRDGNAHIGGSAVAATVEEIKDMCPDMPKVTKEEYDEALRLEQPIIEAQLKALHDRVEADAKQAVQQIDAVTAAIVTDPYGNVTPYEEVCEPIVEETSSTPYIDNTPVQDAEIIQ